MTKPKDTRALDSVVAQMQAAGTYVLCVPFGSLPIGARFERTVWEKDPRDRRRRILVRWRYIKDTHGVSAGFARGNHGDWRSDHHYPVYIDAADIRLAAICLSSAWSKPNAQ